MKNNVISIYGAPSSGKTTLSLKFAKEFANENKNVVVVFCDTISPPISTQIKFKDKNLGSLGAVLESDELNQDVILRNCTFTDKNSYMGFLGYKTNENPRSYAAYSKEKAKQLIEMLSRMVDYVIVDCSSDLSNSNISSVALDLSTKIVYTLNCTMKSLAFFSANKSFIEDKETVKIVNQLKEDQDMDAYINAYKRVNYAIPYVYEVEEQTETFGLFNKTKNIFDELIKTIFKKELLNEN